jgi:hypothetical protein
MPVKDSHIAPEASKERFMLPFRFIEISILQQRAKQRLRGVLPSLDEGENV